MSKGIELTQSQIKAYENGAIKFLFSIDILDAEAKDVFKLTDDEFIKNYAPIQKGDKDIYIKVEHTCNNFDMQEDVENKSCKGCYPEYSFSECIDVKVIKVQDIEWVMGFHFQRFYNRCMEERNINRTYKDNDYVFSVEFKR